MGRLPETLRADEVCIRGPRRIRSCVALHEMKPARRFKKTHMNTSTRKILSTIAGLAITCAFTVAEEAVTTTTASTNTIGTVTEFSPDTLIIRSETAPAPIRYSYTKTTTYVDEAGAPVSMELVKSGLPVTVYYVKQGDRMIANKVVVRKTTTAPGAAVIEKKTTTTTTTKEKD